MSVSTSSEYAKLLAEIREGVRGSRLRASVAVNGELILLYWRIGRGILMRQEQLGWGAEVITKLAADLSREFPDIKGFSYRNLKYMRQFAKYWPLDAKGPQLVAQIPWGHIRLLLDRVEDPSAREWYAYATVDHGWSRAILNAQIDSDLYHRQGRGVTNFERTLAPAQSELALALLKDPYNFDFLSLTEDSRERDLHRGLMQHLRELLLELGSGFAFVGSEVHLEVGGEDFYLSAVDDLLRHPDDLPSIGLVICRGRNGVIAEYALRDLAKPMGVVTHRLRAVLPAEWEGRLPTIEQLESELAARCGVAGKERDSDGT